MLSHDLQWPENASSALPQFPPLSVSIAHQARLLLFITNLEKESMYYLYTFNIQVILLRMRYYYTKYIIYRLFVYKALHFPEQMTQEDAEGVANCLKVNLFYSFFILSTSSKELSSSESTLLLIGSELITCSPASSGL
jgi:hypothetical protein